MKLLQRFFTGASRPRAAEFDAPIAPDAPFAAIGDIHGCDDLLERMLERLGDGHAVVCVGDYVDRGEQSAAVLRRLVAWTGADAGRRICLAGNHEAMMLDFLDDPEARGPRWLRYGGLQTLASFGVRGVSEGSKGAALVAARDTLRAALGEAAETWLRALPHRWQSGNVAVVHAGADPARPIADQHDETLIWGHAAFERRPRADGVWVVHGHTIVDTPQIGDGRIAIDTGAYATGRLTAAVIAGGEVEFVQV